MFRDLINFKRIENALKKTCLHSNLFGAQLTIEIRSRYGPAKRHTKRDFGCSEGLVSLCGQKRLFRDCLLNFYLIYFFVSLFSVVNLMFFFFAFFNSNLFHRINFHFWKIEKNWNICSGGKRTTFVEEKMFFLVCPNLDFTAWKKTRVVQYHWKLEYPNTWNNIIANNSSNR